MDHRLAQLFRRGMAIVVALHNFVSGTVILNNGRIANRDIRRPLLEVCHGIAHVVCS